MQGLKVGHFSNPEKGTGISVFLFDQPAVGAYFIPGAAPASHEFAILDPETTVSHFHGLVLTGGSAHGLYAAEGAMRWLQEKGMGHAMPHGVIPLVPAAAIYDLLVKTSEAPTAQDAYVACEKATANNSEMGNIGAATGATVGKLIPGAEPMNGGLGFAELTLPNGVCVRAYVVVNALGDIKDEKGNIIAGARYANGEFANCEQQILSGRSDEEILYSQNTTLAAVFTNAAFTKSELKRIAKMAMAGMARAISPIFTRYDGDTVFCVSMGEHQISELTIGTMAAELVRQAIINAVSGVVG